MKADQNGIFFARLTNNPSPIQTHVTIIDHPVFESIGAFTWPNSSVRTLISPLLELTVQVLDDSSFGCPPAGVPNFGRILTEHFFFCWARARVLVYQTGETNTQLAILPY